MTKSHLLKYLQYVALCELKSKDYKVLLYILPKLLKNDSLQINQNKIAEELDIAKSDVSKSLSRLEEENIITFFQISTRKRLVTLKEYTIDEIDELISEAIESNIFFR